MEGRLVRLREIERRPRAALAEAARSILRRSTLLGWLRPAAVDRFEARFDASAAAIIERSFVTNMVRLDALAAELGARFVTVIQPEVGQTLSGDNRAFLEVKTRDYLPGDRYWLEFPELYTRFRRQASAALRARGIEVLDASEYLTVRRVGPGLLIDPVHLNRAGHAKMAELISNHLENTARSPEPGAG